MNFKKFVFIWGFVFLIVGSSIFFLSRVGFSGTHDPINSDTYQNTLDINPVISSIPI